MTSSPADELAASDLPPAASAFRRFVRFGPAAGQLVGWCLVAAVNALVIALTLRLPRSGIGARAMQHVYDATELVAMGVISAALVMLGQRLAPQRRWASLGMMLAPAVLVGAWMLPPDLHGFAGNLVGDRAAWIVIAVGVLAASSAIPIAAVLGRWLGRGYFRVGAVGVAIAVAIANHRVVSHDYPGVHFFAAWFAAVIAGTALATWPAPKPRSALWLLAPAAVSLWALVVPPSNTVRLELYRASGSVVAPWLARIESGMSRSVSVAVSPESARWFRNRSGAADIPPHSPSLLSPDAIVVLLIVDAGRADLLESAHESDFPNITRLKKQSVEFTNARSAAPGTTLSVTSIFTSLYPAQIHWADLRGRDYPHLDKTPRLSELLEKGGVHCLNLQGLPGLANSYGIVRGFEEERILPGHGSHFAGSPEMLTAFIERLGRVDSGRMFAYLHFDDAHAPYDSAGKHPTPFEGYLAEVARVDRELGRFLDFLDAHDLTRRTSIVLSADHGEAFGEHGKFFHATTVYDELLRVPLLVRVPGVAPRKVDEPVSLVDLAPTILDGFGLQTPGRSMGESLVPILRGKSVTLGRPIVAESDRGHRAMVFRDGLKIIADDRLHTIELFDTLHDPGELDNLVDARRDVAQKRRALLDTFFDAHRVKQ